MLRATALLTCLVLSACSRPATEPAGALADASRVRGHVYWLADDLMEGRAAGTRGYELAAGYVASQFASFGLQPGGDGGGWLQAVRMRRGERLAEGAEFSLVRDGQSIPLRFEEEFLPGTSFEQESSRQVSWRGRDQPGRNAQWRRSWLLQRAPSTPGTGSEWKLGSLATR